MLGGIGGNERKVRKKMIKRKKKSGKYWGPRRNGWAEAVSGGQGQYRLFHYPCQIFGISKKLFNMLFWLVGPKKVIYFDLELQRESVYQVSLIFV